ncbi:unnamed protein product [Phytophthora fragariaefolia]|uniref:Unnamed protein product n=1 Tax=Phytophthora fragariaefolia TaxID=1490495 RepID=A0A9W7CUG2_9STRA|nr:unnamed protein product [Phytophthora fragariaefolia]
MVHFDTNVRDTNWNAYTKLNRHDDILKKYSEHSNLDERIKIDQNGLKLRRQASASQRPSKKSTPSVPFRFPPGGRYRWLLLSPVDFRYVQPFLVNSRQI